MVFRCFVLLTFICLATAPARADAIDGPWCFTDGRKIFISGDDITTPEGHRLKGENGHHDFTYRPLGSSAGSPEVIVMNQLDEETMEWRRGNGPVEVWKRRCTLHTS